jgi:hypothetical protein
MTSANLIAYENLLNSWVQSLQSAGDSNVFFLPLLTAAPPFQTGTGFVGNNTNDGNGQTIIAATLNTAAINNGGSGYATGDTFTVNPSVASPQDALAFLTVSAQTSGVVTAITKNLGGTYSRGAPPATAAPTTAVTGSGTGLLLNCNMISQNPHPGAYGYQQYGERFADAIISAIAGKA